MPDSRITRTVYEYVCDFLEKQGFSPTLREISEGCYISTGTATRYLDWLMAKGVIIREPGVPRSIRLGDRPLDFDDAQDANQA